MPISSSDLPCELQTDISNDLAYALIESLKLLKQGPWFMWIIVTEEMLVA